MGVETSEPSLATTEDNEDAAAERESKVRELLAELSRLQYQAGRGPVLEAVLDYANRAGGSVQSTTGMHLNLFTDVANNMRELLDHEPNEAAIGKVQTALDIFNNETVTPDEMGDIITEGGVLGAEKLARRISLAREQRMKEALGLVETEPGSTGQA